QPLLKLLHLRALRADDDARAGRMDDHLDFIARPLDLNLGHARHRRCGLVALVLVRNAAIHVVVDKRADPLVLDQERAERALGRIPARLPPLGDAHAEPDWIALLTHGLVPLVHSHGDVAGALHNRVRPAAVLGLEALDDRTPAHATLSHEQL